MKIEFKAKGLNIYPLEEESGYTLVIYDEDHNKLEIVISLGMIYKLGRDIKKHEPDFDGCKYIVSCPYSGIYCTVKSEKECVIIN